MRDAIARHPDSVAAILLVAVVSIVFGAVLAGGCFYERDLTIYHFPMKKVVRDAMLSGELPLWNPRYSGGQPLAANPAYELFYPPQWLVLLPDYLLGFRLHILLHFYLAALGMYAFCRGLGAKPPAAFFGGLAYSLGGTMLALVNILPFLFAMSWIPPILLFARRFLRDPNRRDFSIAALLVGMQALIGEPVTLLQTWMLIGVYALTRRHWKRVALAGLLIAAGITVAAVQLIPSIDHAADSVRRAGFTYDLVTTWSTPAARAKEVLFPGSLRATVKELYGGRPPFIADLSLGVAAAIFLLGALVTWTRRTPLLLGGIAGAWIVALGDATPLWRMLYAAGLRSIRYPEKFLLTAFVLLVLLATLFLDRLLDGEAKVRRAAIVCGVIWTLLALTQSADLAVRGAIVTLLIVLIAKPKLRVMAIAALALFVIVDLARFRDDLAPAMPRPFFERPPALAALPPDARIFHAADWEWFADSALATPYFEEQRRYWWSVRNGAFPSLPAAWGHGIVLQQDVDETTLQPSADFLAALIRVWKASGQWPPLFDAMAAVTHRAELIAPPSDLAATPVETTKPVAIVGAGANPRIYFAEQIESIGGPHDFSDKVLRGNWSPRVAFVEGDPFVPATGTLHAARQGWTRAEAEVTSDGRALLVFATTPHKYWRATIDGRPAALRTVNLASMAVEVPAGKHAVALTYRNPLVLFCGAISLAALLLLVVLAVRRS